MKPKKNYRIPFRVDMSGLWSMMEWTSATDPDTASSGSRATWLLPDEWRENSEFYAELVLDGWSKGRSAVRVSVINVLNNERYSMGLAAFYEAVESYGVSNGTMTGKWTFRKQGANYGLVPMVEQP